MKTSTIILLLALTVLTLVPSQAEGKARRCKGKVQGQYTHAHQCKDSGKYQVLHSLSDQMELKVLSKFVFIQGADVVQRIKMDTESLGTEGRMLRVDYVSIVLLKVRGNDELDRIAISKSICL